MFYKPEARRHIQTIRRNLAQEAINQAAKSVAAKAVVLPALTQAKHIAFYLPANGELDPTPIFNAFLNLDKHFYLPKLVENDKHLRFYPYTPQTELTTNRYGILEPLACNENNIAPEHLDCVLVPLIGFDQQGNRLGHGSGYYDVTFAFRHTASKPQPLLIGLAYEFQKIETITPNQWDVPLDIILTEKEIYYRY